MRMVNYLLKMKFKFLKIKLKNFQVITCSESLVAGTNYDEVIYDIACKLYEQIEVKEAIRLLGITAGKLLKGNTINLFENTDDRKKALYNAIDSLKEKFGEKIFKVSLDGGFTCPNRDGTLSYKGCIFCSESGSGEFTGNRENSITNQINEQIKFLEKGVDKKYIAYFQNFTGTYGNIEHLRSVYEEAIKHPNIVGLAIATRADCLSEEVLGLLSEFNKKTHLWIEIGLQTVNDKTAEIINRGYKTEVFTEKMKELNKRNIKVVTHVIIGLPNENKNDVFSTIDYINEQKTWGIKLHLLYILKNTGLFEYYKSNPFEIMKKEEYISLVTEIISRLDKKIVTHRLTGDAPWKDLYEPKWSTDKRGILNGINKFLKEKKIYQGKERRE